MPRAVLDPIRLAPPRAFSLGDQQRSIRRFLANALGSPPWTVRVGRARVADDDRPVAVVELAAPAVTLQARSTIPQGDVQRQQTFALALYPPLDGVEGPLSEPAASQQAASVAELLSDAITIGLVFDDGALLSPPLQVPVYDFADVRLTGPTRAGPDEPYGWLQVDDYPVRPIVDPDDPRRWTVMCDLRVSWWQGGRIGTPAPAAGSMPGGFGRP